MWPQSRATYAIQRDRDRDTYDVSVTDTDRGYRIDMQQGDEKRSLVADGSLAVLRFEFQNAPAGTLFEAVRNGKVIEVQGLLKGKPMKKELSIDDRPWFQFIEYGLSHALAGGRDTVRFWYLDADECEIHEMEARMQGAETLKLTGRNEECWRVRVNLTGLAALFWHGTYWFRVRDGEFLRYETTEGPGGPRIVVELEREGEGNGD